MRPLNRPMFKMGGPVKEGIMDGIREPKADGGTIGGGTIVGQDVGKGRTGFSVFNLIGGGIAALRAAGPAAVRGFQAARTFKPGKLGFVDRTKDIFSVRGGLGLPMASRPESVGFRVGSFARQNPFLTLSTPSLATTAVTAGGPAVLGAGKAIANFLVPGERFDPFRPKSEIKKEDIAQSQVGQKGKDTKDPKVETENKFQDDGTKKDTSVERLLKGVVKRARTDAAADTAIKFGQQLRTGQASIKDPTSVIDVASEEFDKVSELQKKVDLARIENELKKQQIKEQALATDKYIAASKATGMPVSYTARKALGIPTSVNETAAVYDKAQAGFSGTDDGAQVIASDWANLENKFFQGPLGNSEQLKTAKKTEEFQISLESVILKSIEEIDGNDGIYTFGTQIYEYTNGVVKRLR